MSRLLPEGLNESQKFLRKLALNCLQKALFAVKPEYLIEKSVKIRNGRLIINDDVFDLKDYNKIYVIGGGKATAEMVFTLERILKNFPIDYEGIVNIPKGLDIRKSQKTKNIHLNYATHPIPDENGVNGAKKMLELINNSSKNDLIICLISGGGSALLPLPQNGISLEDLQQINSLLLASGASIHEINAIRKHISKIKGGNLAKTLFNSSGATLISLIISDVVGNNLDSIASGPTVPDPTTFKDVLYILNKYTLYDKIPKSVKNLIEEGFKNRELETPKSNDPCFVNIHNYLIGSVFSAVEEITSYLEPDFRTNYFSDKIIGEARDYGKELFQFISQYLKNKNFDNVEVKDALIGSGELTVTIKGEGKGGRNQEMLLSFLDVIKNKNIDYNFLILAVNLDGIEGNSQAMGALVDNFTLRQIINKNLNIKYYLDNNDSNSFFKILNSEIITGPTGCNVNDLILILILK
jgi:glycerate 2-kinase